MTATQRETRDRNGEVLRIGTTVCLSRNEHIWRGTVTQIEGDWLVIATKDGPQRVPACECARQRTTTRRSVTTWR